MGLALVQRQATRFTDAWTTFLSVRKNWGYRQDQLSSTHPVYCEMPDVEAVEVNFDGITYAKGASVLKQLVAYVGHGAFLAGLRGYFAAHAWGNATFDDLLAALEAASGRPLREFAASGWRPRRSTRCARRCGWPPTARTPRSRSPGGAAGAPDPAHPPDRRSACTTWTAARWSGASWSRWTSAATRTECRR